MSFAVCYRLGVPRNERSLNLTQWALQILGLLSVYFACQLEEVSILVWTALIAREVMPKALKDKARFYW